METETEEKQGMAGPGVPADGLGGPRPGAADGLGGPGPGVPGAAGGPGASGVSGAPEKQPWPQAVYKLMIVAAAAIWGLGFVVMKDAVGVLPPAYLIGIRFFLTGLVLAAVFQKRIRAHLTLDHLASGCCLGVLIFLGFWVQTIGLTDTTPGKNAFLTATYCVLVPFVFWLVARRPPTAYNIGAAFLCIAGVGLVSLQDSLTMRFGDYMTLLSAVAFAAHIAFVAKLSSGRDVFVLSVWQFLVAGMCGVVIGAATETLPPIDRLFEPSFLGDMVYLVVFGSCVALMFQNVALSRVPPAQGALLLSLESVFGVGFSVLFYGEPLSLRLLAGFVLIFGAIVVSEVFPLNPKEGAAARAGSREQTRRLLWRRARTGTAPAQTRSAPPGAVDGREEGHGG